MKKVIIEAVNISKKIEGKSIIKNVSFQCKEHSSIAINGQNGSGKSTLLKILAGISEPTNGKIKRNTTKIGYVPEHFPENLRFKLKEYLFAIGSFHGYSRVHIEDELSKYISLFEIEAFLGTPLKRCSKGTKQKVGIIQALLTKPDILLLDEPLTGLDIDSQQNLIHLLGMLKKQVTIIFTSHEQLMIEKIANQILDIRTGETLLHKQLRKRQIRVEFKDREIFRDLDTLNLQYEGNIALLTVDSEKSDRILIDLLNKNCSVLEVREKG